MQKLELRVGSVVEAEVIDLGFGGEGVARYEGMVIFVPFVAVGDRVLIKITQSKKHFYRGFVMEMLNASEDREEPVCEYFGLCGGCDYQHITYEAELEIKSKQIRDLLKRIGEVSHIRFLPFIRADSPYGYRNRVTVHQQDWRIGFHGKDSRDVVDIDKCQIASDEVNEKLAYLRGRPGNREHYSLRGSNIPELGFFQTNQFLLKRLRDLVRGAVDHRMKSMVEGYSGVGFFSEVLQDEVEDLVTIESDVRAVLDAQKRVSRRVKLLEGSCEQYLEKAFRICDQHPVGCFLDPPREGLSDELIEKLLRLDFQQLIYLSCNPSTLARDLRKMQGFWMPLWLQPIDMFPRTAHIECLVVCERIN
ncbi:MAG: TRAM domain-containing protein [Verrucomicrobiota bacterium]